MICVNNDMAVGRVEIWHEFFFVVVNCVDRYGAVLLFDFPTDFTFVCRLVVVLLFLLLGVVAGVWRRWVWVMMDVVLILFL